MTQDRPIIGIALMLGFCITAPLGDAVAKLLGETPVVVVIFLRFALQVVFMLPLIHLGKRNWRVPRAYLGIVVVRTILHMLGIATMFTALKHLPLADAVAIAFVCPFILLLLGRLFLNEEIGIHRLMACAVGFAGTLMVIQPSFSTVGWPALLPLGTAVIFALYILTTRQIAKVTDPLGIQAVSGVIACVLMLPVLYFGQGSSDPALQPTWPDSSQWLLLLALGGLGTLSHLLMTWSLRFAPSATLAPMQYIEIPVATLIGWMVFSQFPNTLAGVGIAITMGAGLYAIWREQLAAQKQPTATPQMAE